MSTVKSKPGKGRIRALVRRGSEAGKRPRSAPATAPPPERSVCRICGADYARRTWRRRQLAAPAAQPTSLAVCPACAQVRREEGLGSVVARGPFIGQNRAEIRRRIRNVCRRAGFTQPQRKLVSLRLEANELEIRTTSQKLAHRIGAELGKAFGGRVSYRWIDRDGTLRATWEPRVRPA
jgi:hypothetical protein